MGQLSWYTILPRGRRRSFLISIVTAALLFSFAIFSNVRVLQMSSAEQEVREPQVRPLIDRPYAHSPPEVEKYFSPPEPSRKDHHEWNNRVLRDLHTCMALDNCGKNQRKVALLAAHWFAESIIEGFHGGEGVWAASVYRGLQAMGYTTLFSTSFKEALEQYRRMPDLVKVVIRNMAGECHRDNACVKNPENPSGIPAWKIFDFEYYPSPRGGHHLASLLKGKWILSAMPDDIEQGRGGPLQYIGFSVEDECKKVPVVPLDERRGGAWIFMKEVAYVYDNNFAWNRSYFPLVAEELGINFTGAWNVADHYNIDPPPNVPVVDIEDHAHGIYNFGKLLSDRFVEEMSQSKVLVGVGNPWWSPSPYYSLCLGVPFINPILRWAEDDPQDQSRWYTQHPSVVRFGPPYVYHVHARDYDGFLSAIKSAISTEIASFVPEHMTNAALQTRLWILMETDWKQEAQELLAETLAANNGGYIFEI